MIRAAIVGLGWWGQNLVNSVRDSAAIRFSVAHTRTRPTAAAFCADAGLRWTDSLDAILGDATLYSRQDMVEASWGVVKPIQEVWHRPQTSWRGEPSSHFS